MALPRNQIEGPKWKGGGLQAPHVERGGEKYRVPLIAKKTEKRWEKKKTWWAKGGGKPSKGSRMMFVRKKARRGLFLKGKKAGVGNCFESP